MTSAYIKLEVSFKGDRNYLQAGDIYNAIDRSLPVLFSSSDFYIKRLTFRRFCNSQVQLTHTTPIDQKAIVATVTFGKIDEDQIMQAWVVETGVLINTRVDFNESLITKLAITSDLDGTVTLSRRTGFTFIEELISLAKQLNYYKCPDISGRWVVGQLAFDLIPPINYIPLRVQMTSLVKDRFSICTIFVGHDRIGSVQFIVGDPL